MNISSLVCSNCEAELQTDTDFYVCDRNGAPLCEECYYVTFYDASQVLIYVHETSNFKIWSFNSTMGLPYDENVEELRDDDKKMMPIKDVTRVFTNGTSGYYQHKLKDGYTMLKDDYTELSQDRSKGRWKNVPWKHWLNELMDDLFGESETHPPCDVFCVTSPTSTLFVNKTSLVVRSRDINIFFEWLENEYGLTIEELENSLQNVEGTLKEVAAKKQDKSTTNNSKQPQKQLTGYQKEILYMKQVFQSIGLPTSALETTGAQKPMKDPTISVTTMREVFRRLNHSPKE